MQDSGDRPSRSFARDWMAEIPSQPPPLSAPPIQPPRRHRVRIRVLAGALAVVLVAGALAGGLVLASQAPAPTPSPSPTPTPTATVVATPMPTPTATPTPAVPTPRVTGTVINVGPTAAPTPVRPTPPDELTGYVWPLDDANQFQVTLPFGPSPWGELLVGGQPFHDGVDMATQCGDNVRAAHDGTVLVASRDYVDFMGWQGDLTRYKARFASPSWKATLPVVIVIDDGDGYRSIYAHEWSNVKVKAGQHVKAGQVIGYEGATGNASGCHLHFGLYSPLETATFDNQPKYMAYPNRLPASVTARIDPLLVLPYRNDVAEMRILRPWDAALWDATHPSPSPSHK